MEESAVVSRLSGGSAVLWSVAWVMGTGGMLEIVRFFIGVWDNVVFVTL